MRRPAQESPRTVRRARLSDALLTGTSSVIVEAGGGFGKSILVSHLAAEQAGCFIRRLPRWDSVGLEDLRTSLAAVGSSEPGGEIVVIDNVHALDDEGASWLADEACEAVPIRRLILLGRVMPPPLAALEFDGQGLRLGADDLRFSADDTRALVGLEVGEDDVDWLAPAVHRRADGWPALVGVLVRRIALATDRFSAAADLLRNGSLLEQILGRYTSELEPSDRDLFVELARLRLVNERSAARVGSPGLLRRLLKAGIPYADHRDGWYRLPDAVAEHAACSAFDHRPAGVPERPLVRGGGQRAAASRLAGGGHDRHAVHQLRAVNGGEAVGGGGGPSDEATAGFLRAAQAEAASLPEAAELEALLGTCEKGTGTHATVLEALGIALSESPLDRCLRRAEEALVLSAIVWEELGAFGRARAVRRNLAQRVMGMQGRLGAAAALLGRLALDATEPYERTCSLMSRALMLSYAGEFQEAVVVLGEVLPSTDHTGPDRVQAYAAWTRLLVSASEGDEQGVLRELGAGEAHVSQLPPGLEVVFLTEAADACMTVGAEAQADRLLATAAARPDARHYRSGLTAAWLNARRGRPAGAAQLEKLISRNHVPPAARWKTVLLRGYAELLAGNPSQAQRLLRESVNHAARIGHPELVERREPGVLNALRAALPRSARNERREVVAVRRDDVARIREVSDDYTLTVMGGFELRRGTEVLPVPPGQQARLLKYLVLAEGTASVESIVELLWPDEEPGVGKRRLRNVLSRSRAHYGPLIRRDGDRLRLAACRIDLLELQRRMAAVGSSGHCERVQRAREALELYRGPLLPADLYDDRVSRRREALNRSVVRLVDIVLAAALAAGDLDNALCWVRVALELDPYFQERPLRVARCLREAGKESELRMLTADVMSATELLGLPPAQEWYEFALGQGLAVEKSA